MSADTRVELACGCVKVYDRDIMMDVLLCKDHEEIYTLLAFWPLDKTMGKIIEPPALGVTVNEQIEIKDKVR